jgi:hypothetical protein
MQALLTQRRLIGLDASLILSRPVFPSLFAFKVGEFVAEGDSEDAISVRRAGVPDAHRGAQYKLGSNAHWFPSPVQYES